VLGIKYDKGVMLANDTMVCYGNTKKFPNKERVCKVGKHTAVGAAGEMADFQFLERLLTEIELEDWQEQDAHAIGPRQTASFLSRVLYNRRCKFQPLLNQLIVGGWDKYKGQPELGYIDSKGCTFKEEFLASGFGGHLAIPLMRSACDEGVGGAYGGNWKTRTETQCRELLTKCLQVLFYRDCKASREVQFTTITAEGTKIEDPVILPTKWDHPTWMKPSSALPGAGTSW